MLSLEIYSLVLAWKLKRPLSLVKHFGFDEAETALRQDMAMNKVVWYDHFFQDWWWSVPASPAVISHLRYPLPALTD